MHHLLHGLTRPREKRFKGCVDEAGSRVVTLTDGARCRIRRQLRRVCDHAADFLEEFVARAARDRERHMDETVTDATSRLDHRRSTAGSSDVASGARTRATEAAGIKCVQEGLGNRRHVGCKLGKRRAAVNREVDVVDAVQPNQSRKVLKEIASVALVIVKERVPAQRFSGFILVTSAKQCADIWNPPGFEQETRLDNGQRVWVLDDGDIKILVRG